jgi:4-hydroxybenzoate polyprenyltransferase
MQFFVACLAFTILGILYSHPATRWKGNPWLSWLVVMGGQGGIGTAAGVVAGQSAHLTPEIACGLVAAAALVGGLYPLTQLFQTEEDHARGDRTTAIALGRTGTRAASAFLSLIGAAFAGLSAYFAGRNADALLLALAAVPMTAGAIWVCAPGETKAVFRRVSRFQLAAGGAFGVYAVLRLCFT